MCMFTRAHTVYMTMVSTHIFYGKKLCRIVNLTQAHKVYITMMSTHFLREEIVQNCELNTSTYSIHIYDVYTHKFW